MASPVGRRREGTPPVVVPLTVPPRYVVGATMRHRWQEAPSAARTRGHEGNQRLHRRWTQLAARNKKHTVANTAIARELAGWCWSLATLPD